MGKQARRKRERDPAQAWAARYLARVGLPARPDPGPWRRMAAAEPDWYRSIRAADDDALAVAGRAGADPADVLGAGRARYSLVYRDLDTALAEYASRPVMIAAAWLAWWRAHHPAATRLLDAGCGAGILTCAYGLALPGAEVVGLDASPEALRCARELADRLGVGNVSFVAGDLASAQADSTLVDSRSSCSEHEDRTPSARAGPPAELSGFDQITAVTALADAGCYPQGPPDEADETGGLAGPAGAGGLSGLAEIDGPAAQFRSPGVAALVTRLVPGGALLAFDRTPHAAQATRLGAALLHAGVDVDWARCGTEMFVEEGEATTFTRFAGRRADGPAVTSDRELSAWIRARPAPAYGAAWHDELAFETLRRAGAELVFGVQIDYSPHSPVVERREVWVAGGAAHGWITTNAGLRELVAGRSAEALRAEYGAYADRFAAAGLAVRRYEA